MKVIRGTLLGTLLVALILGTAACKKSESNSSPAPQRETSTTPTFGSTNGNNTISNPDLPPTVVKSNSPEEILKNNVSEVLNLKTFNNTVPPTVDLNLALNKMLDTSSEIYSAEKRVEEYQYYTDIAKKKIFPDIDATATYNHSTDASNYQNYTVGFQHVIWDGTYKNNVKMNVFRQLAEEHRLRAVRTAMVVQTTARYTNLLTAQGQLQARTAHYDALKKVYDQVESAYKMGFTDKQVMYEALAQLKKGQLALQDAKGKARVACLGLLEVMSESDLNLCMNPAPIDDLEFNPPSDTKEAVVIALKNRPEVAIDLSLIEVAKMGQAIARAQFYPKVIVSANYGYSNAPFGGGVPTMPGIPSGPGGFEKGNVGVGVTIPIFDWGKKKKAKKAAEAKVQQAQADLVSTQKKITTEVLSNLVGLETSVLNVETAQAQLEASKNLYENALISYKLGTTSLTDLFQYLTDYIDADHGLLLAQYGLYMNLVYTKASLGFDE